MNSNGMEGVEGRPFYFGGCTDPDWSSTREPKIHTVIEGGKDFMEAGRTVSVAKRQLRIPSNDENGKMT